MGLVAAPALAEDITAGHIAVQVPRRLVGAYLAAKIAMVEEVSAADPDESEPRWKALLRIDQMLMATPTQKHVAEGLATQAAVLKRRLKWVAQAEWEALLRDATPEEAGAMRTPPSELQRLRSKAHSICTLAAAGEKGGALNSTNAAADILKTPETAEKLRRLFPPAPPWPATEVGPQAGAHVVEAATTEALEGMGGMIGGRAEHWEMQTALEGGARLLGMFLHHILVATSRQERCGR